MWERMTLSLIVQLYSGFWLGGQPIGSLSVAPTSASLLLTENWTKFLIDFDLFYEFPY